MYGSNGMNQPELGKDMLGQGQIEQVAQHFTKNGCTNIKSFGLIPWICRDLVTSKEIRNFKYP